MALDSSSLSFFSAYFKNHFVKLNLLVGLLANGFLWLYLAFQARDFSGLIPLHYNIYFGIDLLGPWYHLYIMPAIGLVFLTLNFLFGALVYGYEKMLSYFLAVGSSLIQFLLIFSAVFIIFINS